MFYNYMGYKYHIGNEYIRIFDTRGVEVSKLPVNNKKNHLQAHAFIENKLNKKPKVTIGLYEVEPYHWDVYYGGKEYLGSVRQMIGGVYLCYDGDYETYLTESISGVMDYFRGIVKQKGKNETGR